MHNDERIGKLEKQLLAEVKKNNSYRDYDLQAKCGNDSRIWFDEHGQGDKDTLLLTYTNHYSKSKNKCFVMVEYHNRYNKELWANMLSVWDPILV